MVDRKGKRRAVRDPRTDQAGTPSVRIYRTSRVREPVIPPTGHLYPLTHGNLINQGTRERGAGLLEPDTARLVQSFFRPPNLGLASKEESGFYPESYPRVRKNRRHPSAHPEVQGVERFSRPVSGKQMGMRNMKEQPGFSERPTVMRTRRVRDGKDYAKYDIPHNKQQWSRLTSVPGGQWKRGLWDPVIRPVEAMSIEEYDLRDDLWRQLKEDTGPLSHDPDVMDYVAEVAKRQAGQGGGGAGGGGGIAK